jgi:hypothetical protein
LAHLRASTLLCSLCTSLARGGRMWLRREEEEEGARWAAPAEGMADPRELPPPPPPPRRSRRDGGSWGAPLLLELRRSCLLAPVDCTSFRWPLPTCPPPTCARAS